MKDTPKEIILVTGASGFLAMHIIKELLDRSYSVRGTLRSMDKKAHLQEVYGRLTNRSKNLQLILADLTKDEGWATATAGCRYVHHVASPFPPQEPKHEDELIIPAREGTLRVLRAAAKTETVERLVLTSSVVSIMEGYGKDSRIFNEDDWSNLDGHLDAYPKSKTLAEKSAWHFMTTEKPTFDMVTIHPGTVLGPVLDVRQTSTSAETILKLLRREVPGVAAWHLPVVDVRDVAAAHLAAMTTPHAGGKRYICNYASVWMSEIAHILQENFGPRGYRVPTRILPSFLVRLVGYFDPTVKLIVDRLHREVHLDNSRIKLDLNWQPHNTEEMVVAMAESLIELGAA